MPHEFPSTLFKVLDILNDCEVHTGNDMAKALGVTRTAVWKIIQRLKAYNFEIQTKHQGYCLSCPLILFDKEKIETALKDPKVSLEIFETISSTSDYLKNKTPLNNIHLCLAEYQSKGNGRLGRDWISPFGRNIYCSLSYMFNKDIGEMSGLSLMVGILTVKALESLDKKINPLLKWPNDIYLNNQKMGGILIDLIAEANGNCRAIISVGLNVNMKDVVLETVSQPWTSLEHDLNEKLDRNIVFVQLIQSMLRGIEIFCEKGIDPILAEWKKYDMLENKNVSIKMGTKTLSGIAKGINPQGYLLLELPNGVIEKVSYGDTALKAI